MTRSVLYIEDEEDYQLLVTRMLNRAGLDVEIAGTGQEGLSTLRRSRPSLILLDVNLPDTDGYSFCDRLREEPAWADLPVLMLTVRHRPEEWLRGFSSGANDYMSKPINPPELIERVRHCLDGKMPRRIDAAAPEFQLIQAAAGGNRAAFEVVIRKYKARLLKAVGTLGFDDLETEDIIAQVFAQAYEKLPYFRGASSFYTWLYRIAFNEVIRRTRRVPAITLQEAAPNDEATLPKELIHLDPPPESLDSSPTALAALRKVEQPYRRMLEYFFLKDWSYGRIAEKLELPVGTVMSRLFKARRLLKEAWDDLGP